MSLLDFKIDEQFLQTHTVEFRLPLEDPKTHFLAEDAPLEFEGRFYYITELQKIREGNETYVSVEGNASWYRLGERKYIGIFLLTGLTPGQGLQRILAAARDNGLDWHTGALSSSTAVYGMEATDRTFLELIYQWAKVCQCEVTFDTSSNKVNMAETLGANYGLSFRYDRNLASISRTVVPPLVTRLYPYGRANLDISGINPTGEVYIEDYSFYTAQGLTLVEAEALYRKDDVYQDDTFIDEASLYAAAVARLALLAQPTISYAASVVDLSDLTGFNESQFALGDYVVVEDDPLGISVITRVVRLVRYPYEPHRNQVELSYLPITLPDAGVSTTRSLNRDWELFETCNRVAPRYFWGEATGILHYLPLSVSSQGEWVLGFKMRAVGHGSCNVTLSAIDLNDDSELWPSETFSVTDGQLIEKNFTIGDKTLVDGLHGLQIRIVSDTGGAGLTVETGESTFWALARSVVQQSPVYGNSITFNPTGAVQYWSAPIGVDQLHVDIYGGGGGQGMYADETLYPTLERAGYGGWVSGDLAVSPEEQFEVYVGQAGGYSGGWPGGAEGGTLNDGGRGGGGGGYSGLLRAGDPTTQFVAIAGGGGGAGQAFTSDHTKDISGGDGGFYRGGDGGPGDYVTVASGATQYSGGISSNGSVTVDNQGQFLQAGRGGNGSTTGSSLSAAPGGGGGGWWGGAGNAESSPANAAGGGSGGSGWATRLDNLEFSDGVNEGNGYVIISWATPE